MRRLIVSMIVFAFAFVVSLLPAAVLAQPCEGNFDCDQDVDGTDAAVFKEDFGRSLFFNPCPNCPSPAGVPKTGQTTSYATGDDGDLERGVELVTPRFTDNGDGTVADNQTGLIWLKNANCFGQRAWLMLYLTAMDWLTAVVGLLMALKQVIGDVLIVKSCLA